jgi:hypothetical protein
VPVPLSLLLLTTKVLQKFRKTRAFWIWLMAAIPWDWILFFIWLGYSDEDHYIDPVLLDVIQVLSCF